MRVWLWMALLWSLAASAHPLSRDKYSLRTQVRVELGKVEAVVVLEVPFDVVMQELRGELEIAQEKGREAARAVLDAYAQRQFRQLGDGLSVTVDGKRIEGRWRAKSSPYNGKGAVTEGFFMYIVEFVPSGSVALDDDVTLVVANTSYADKPMAYSAWAVEGQDWAVAESSAHKSLPTRSYDPTSPDFWVEDPALRTLTVRVTRKP